MPTIHELIAQIRDPHLRQCLAAEWASAAKDKKFGLVIEDHLPELLPLHGAKPRKGDLVCRRHASTTSFPRTGSFSSRPLSASAT